MTAAGGGGRVLLVVPARYGSSRFPGKPLVEIAGATLLQRVGHLARAVVGRRPDMDFTVATEDERILRHAAELGLPAVMTGDRITSGSGRALAAAEAVPVLPDIVVNLQGDAPFTEPETILTVVDMLRQSTADVATAAVRLDWAALDALREHKLRAPFSGTTCIRSAEGQAIWFSKTIIPAMRDEAEARGREPTSPVLRHIGLYAYRLAALRRFEAAPVSAYERLEGLEQLRLLELGMSIALAIVPPPRIAMAGIDTPEDRALAETMIARHGDPLTWL